mmetsp:Transcript_35206/g.76918  ORF Transcript_35206/g.76918 Transcript_35206/m.76918 type:complete len:125 (+) Transcript_35206:2055-2429(+)
MSKLTNDWVEAIHTIDSFQGKECDVVLISLVRSNNEGNVGFLSNRNRTNVMMTRAKSAMIIVGDQHCIQNNTLWNKIIYSYIDDGLLYDSFEDMLLSANQELHSNQHLQVNEEEEQAEDEDDFM